VTALAFSPDGRWLTSAANDHSIRLWAIPDAPARVPAGQPDDMRDFTLDAGTGCVVARAGGALTMWDPQQSYAPRSLPGTERHFHAGFLAQGRGFIAVEIATNGVPVSLEIRLLPEGTVQTRRDILPAPKELQSSETGGTPFPAASPDGQWVAVPQTSVDGVRDVHVFSVVTGQFVTRLPGWPRALVFNLRASPDSRWLVFLAHYNGTNLIATYDSRSWRRAHDVMGAAIDPASRFIATGGTGENSLRIWDLSTGRLTGRCNGNVIGWHPVWSRDSRTLVVRDTGGLRLWSMVVFRELATLPLAWHHTHMPLGFTADGRALVLHLMDGRLQAWSPPALTETDLQP
jgi:WD40 repeat protein